MRDSLEQFLITHAPRVPEEPFGLRTRILAQIREAERLKVERKSSWGWKVWAPFLSSSIALALVFGVPYYQKNRRIPWNELSPEDRQMLGEAFASPQSLTDQMPEYVQ